MAVARTKAAPAAQPAAAPEPQVAREAARPEVREAPSIPLVAGRAVGYTRSGQPIQRTSAEAGVDQFFIPPHLPPQGWSWEWKRETAYGETDPQYMSAQHQVGWEPVMYESYPGIFAPAGTVGPVRRKGLMLMERSMALTKEAKDDELRKARMKVGNAVRQYNRLDTSGTSTAEFDHEAQRASYIKQGNPEPLPPLHSGGRQQVD